MKVLIAASGEVEDLAVVRELAADAELVVAADGGLAHLLRARVRADLVVGDLDSATPSQVEAAERDGAEVERHETLKDETDLELALLAVAQRGATEVVVVGLFGGRVDHELANVSLLAAKRWNTSGMAVSAHDGLRSLWVVHDWTELDLLVGTTTSLLPWAGDAVVSASGVQWPLDRARLAAGTPRGVSNVVTNAVQSVAAHEGTVLVIVDRSQATQDD